jgi:hypothetical protein
MAAITPVGANASAGRDAPPCQKRSKPYDHGRRATGLGAPSLFPFDQRREKVEHPFATLKMRMGATHFFKSPGGSR